jgi:flagellar protein FlaG
MFIPAVTGSVLVARASTAQAVPGAVASARPAAVSADVHQAIAAIRETLRPVSNSLEFSVDRTSGTTIVRVVDLETNQLVRQIPSEELVEIARVLERLEGLLFRQRA